MKDKFLPKEIYDRIIACVLVCMFSPLIFLIWAGFFLEGLLFRSRRGSVLYKEKRVSKGKVFFLYKFRTLKPDVARSVSSLDSATFLQCDGRNITFVGKLLIKFYMDELPQLFNVLRGDMSLVGPRPRIPSIYEDDLADGYTALRNIKGGLTGPSQLCKGIPGENGMSASERYLEKCYSSGSVEILLNDLAILGKTLSVIAKAKGL